MSAIQKVRDYATDVPRVAVISRNVLKYVFTSLSIYAHTLLLQVQDGILLF